MRSIPTRTTTRSRRSSRDTNVTHLQCTPSMAKMIAMNEEMRAGLASVQHLYIGGEAFPASLARELSGFVRGDVTNMYGPTETTIWSTTHGVHGTPDSIPIGRPIANTQIYLLDRHLEPVPVGVAGELYIGGRRRRARLPPARRAHRRALRRRSLRRQARRAHVPDRRPRAPSRATARSSSSDASTTRSRSAAIASSSARSRPSSDVTRRSRSASWSRETRPSPTRA